MQTSPVIGRVHEHRARGRSDTIIVASYNILHCTVAHREPYMRCALSAILLNQNNNNYNTCYAVKWLDFPSLNLSQMITAFVSLAWSGLVIVRSMHSCWPVSSSSDCRDKSCSRCYHLINWCYSHQFIQQLTVHTCYSTFPITLQLCSTDEWSSEMRQNKSCSISC